MLLFRLTLLLSLICYLAAYPVEVPVKPAGQENRVALDPADYPDLTNGLSDAEVESTLNGLSLEDLNALNKLLDDANNGPVELEASLRGHHRQAKKQHYEEMENTDDEQSVNDNCHDEDDLDKERDPCTVRPKCNKQPTCPTTKRCTSTRRCFTTSCKSLDGLLNINFDGERSNKKYRKLNAKPQEECDPEDVLCIQRNRDKAKQRPNMQDFSDLSLDQDQGNNIDSLEKLAAEAHQDQSLELHKDLDGWQSKGEPSADIFNMDPYKVPNVDSNGNANDLKESPKLTGLIAEDEGQPAQSEEEAKLGEAESPYERHQLARVAHEDHLKADEEQQPEEIEDNRQLNAAPALSQERYNDDLEVEAGEPHGNLAANEGNEGDSFIAQNAQEPMRYVIQTDDGLIQSENEQGEHRLRTDKQHSEMLNFATYQLAKEANPQLEFKRFKRDNKKTDDAPENSNESYLKKLMDSFPRDQVSQSNLNIAIREAKRAHLRVKRC
ncbi:uncharacterized protein LOC117565328 isoform X1 [Drosophila albomicans]|uniref:Uncharacterized protein LOC117565328 isoform X1 n=2 Tax=Drosophila albomicans TaxID=7291 RepID=A0A9C6T341_DROAB|nr:uncharacterized protein LOC117565328 isoform X1 [Drosophila albomicans]